MMRRNLDYCYPNDSLLHKMRVANKMIPRWLKVTTMGTWLAVAGVIGWQMPSAPKNVGKKPLTATINTQKTENEIDNLKTMADFDKYLQQIDPADEPKRFATLEELSGFIHQMEHHPQNITKEISQFWYQRYTDPNGLKRDLDRAYYESGTHINQLKKIFRDGGWDENYAYLFIPESHWLNKTSKTGASGKYQIMPQTARSFGLIVNETYDGRLDVIQSANLVVKYLNECATRFNCRDADILLAAYNSGKPNIVDKYRRRRQIKIVNSVLSIVPPGQGDLIERTDYALYQKYLAYELKKIQEKINKLNIDQSHKERKFALAARFIAENEEYPSKLFAVLNILEKNYFRKQAVAPEIKYKTIQLPTQINYCSYKVKPKDTWESIAQKYQISIKSLRETNHHLRLQSGTPLTLPLVRRYSFADLAKEYQISPDTLLKVNPAIKSISSNTKLPPCVINIPVIN